MARDRRPSLAAVARSRGYEGVSWCAASSQVAHRYEAWAWGDGVTNDKRVCEVNAPTRRAAEAGLRAALEALPARKDEKR